MTEQEHELLTWKIRSALQQHLLDWVVAELCVQHGSLSEDVRFARVQIFRARLWAAKKDIASTVIRGLHPVESNLYMDLFQQSFDEISKKLLTDLGDDAPPLP